MLKAAGILAFMFFAVVLADAQERMDLQALGVHLKSPLVSDTISFRSRPLFILPLSFGDIPHYQPNLFQRIPSINEPFFAITSANDIDLALPWKQQLAGQNDFRTWELILGSIEAGGVGYIAYQHIRKFGL